jgi:hypothetical protein
MMIKFQFFYLSLFLFVFKVHAGLNENFKWNFQNHPEKMVEHYTTQFEELPLEGEIHNIPWSGDYWPTQKGGISYRWFTKNPTDSADIKRFGYDLLNMDQYEKDLQNKKHLVIRKTKLDFIKKFGPREGSKKFKAYIKTAPKGIVSPSELSPSEKYDFFMGDHNWTLTKRERRRTEIMKLVEAVKKDSHTNREDIIPSWFGVCHAWAPATILYENPGPIGFSDAKKREPISIKLKNPRGFEVPFGSSDVKALLSIHLDMARAVKGTNTFLGSRCNLDMENHFQRFKRGEISETILYDLLEKKGCNDTNAGSFHITLTNLIGHYKTGFIMDHDRGSEVWNQGVVSYKVLEKKEKDVPENLKKDVSRIISITNEVTWISEIHQNWKKVVLAGRNGLQISSYNYDLYLNESNQIIGGKWKELKNHANKTWKDRPDFLWMRPKVSFSESIPGLSSIYRRSLGKKEDFNAKKLWKKAFKKIKNSQKFIKTTKDLVEQRKEEKEKYIKDLKIKAIKAFKFKIEKNKKRDQRIKTQFGSLLEKIRKKIFKREREIIKNQSHLERKGNKTLCHVLYYNDAKNNYKEFIGEGPKIAPSCDQALRMCGDYKDSNNIKNDNEFCLKGRGQDYLYTCTYTLFSNPDPFKWLFKKVKKGRVMGIFTHKGLIEDLACESPKEKCQKRVFWKRTCKKKVKAPNIRI